MLLQSDKIFIGNVMFLLTEDTYDAYIFMYKTEYEL